MIGVDYAWSKQSIQTLKNEGAKFVCRYISNDPAKDLSQSELNDLKAAGIAIVVVFETNANEMLSGEAAGQADARKADDRVKSLGMPGVPVYFACDFDATPGNQAAINAYLDGAANVLSRGRVGIYGGYYPVKRALDAGKATYAWQTYAWSGGQWDNRAQIRQTRNGNLFDWDESRTDDFGQWPRPGAQTQPVTVQVSLPVLSEGDSDAPGRVFYVQRLQALLNVVGSVNKLSGMPVAEDGNFGPGTLSAVKTVQGFFQLNQDGTVGHDTWTKVLGG